MTRPLKIVITITDVAFILYWTMATLSELNAIEVPPNLMYADYDHPRVVAWNWSFLPIDLVFSIVGLAAVNGSLSFTNLRKLLGTTDGNLSAHARRLEDAGLGELPRPAVAVGTDRAVEAARAVLDEARAMRSAIRNLS